MPISDQIAAQLPYLRRYARALTGSQGSGDAYVRATLEAALADAALREEIASGRAPLYHAFTRIWATGNMEAPRDEDGAHGGCDTREQTAQSRLAAVAPIHRQALLLSTVEDFSYEETAQILGLSPEEVEALIAQAVAEIEQESKSRVLIIEDEPLISMQLEHLVSELGHVVAGTATTHDQALELFRQAPAGLVLADIQLADGSSGIDAVEDLLRLDRVPVIFITAYPERLLTGARPEPTYLVTKPFREATVRAAISQALFFGPAGPSE